MAKLHHEIRIDAPAERVWRVLADLEAVQHYNPMVARARYTSSNREGVGASRHCDFKPKGFAKEQVVGWEPGKAITFEMAESSWPLAFMRWRTNLSPGEAGTLLVQDTEYRFKFGPLGKLLDALVMRRKLDAGIAGIFLELKRFVETGAPAAST